MTETTGYRCATCGEWHEGLPYGFSFRAPDEWFRRRLRDRLPVRCVLGDEQCWIRDRFFLKANVELPLRDGDDSFAWALWTRVGEHDFWRYDESWERAERVELAPFEATVATDVPGYPDTSGLRGLVHTRDLGVRALLVLDGDHPLAREQRDGITPERHRQLVELVLHSDDPRFG